MTYTHSVKYGILVLYNSKNYPYPLNFPWIRWENNNARDD